MGILALAVLGALTIASMVLKHQRQSLNHAAAARLGDTLIERAATGVIFDQPKGERKKFWDGSYPYPSAPYKEGTETVGREVFNYAIYATDLPLGDAGADPPNLIRKLEAHVWWKSEGEVGEKRTVAWRMINSGSEP